MLQAIREFLSPPIFDNEEETRIASHIYIVAKVALLTPVAALPLGAIKGNILLGFAVSLLAIPMGLLPMWLSRKRRVRLAGTIYTVLVWLAVNYSTLYSGGVRAVGFGGNLMVLIAAAMLINIQAMFILGIATSFLGLLLAYLQTNAMLPPIPASVSSYSAWITQTAFLASSAGLMYIATEKIEYSLKRALASEQEVKRLNQELIAAYDTTLEGWAKALELKDKETEGHSRRVTDLMKALALAVGVPRADLIYIYYGSLLHDIGKMGIPDEILNKPGALTEAERNVMKAHPTIAYNLLKDIDYLKKAIEIPYCHHEKWNGEGYPQGLKGAEIPLSARMFAIVDVWDALRSDRPYRAAWSKEKVIEYMRGEAGTHFDPQVLEIFLTRVVVNF